MESSVTDIIAELVMKNVEEKALERSPVNQNGVAIWTRASRETVLCLSQSL